MKGSSGNTIYRECQKIHLNRNGKVDGCQEYMDMGNYPDTCGNCGCLRGFHLPTVEYKRKVVYTKCHKTHDYEFQTTVDGCQEFAPGGEEGTPKAINCAVCGCHKGFHRNEITQE